MNGVFLSLSNLSDSRVWGSSPCYKASGRMDFSISSVGERRFPYHDIDNQYGDIAQRAATRSQVCEGFVSRRIDDEKARNLVFLRSVLIAAGFQPRNVQPPRRVKEYLVENGRFGLDGVHREVGGSDLLCNTASFALLNVCLPDLKAPVSKYSTARGLRRHRPPCPKASSFRYRHVQEYNRWGSANYPYSWQQEQLREPWPSSLQLQPSSGQPSAVSWRDLRRNLRQNHRNPSPRSPKKKRRKRKRTLTTTLMKTPRRVSSQAQFCWKGHPWRVVLLARPSRSSPERM